MGLPSNMLCMIKIKDSTAMILTGPLDAVRNLHAVAKHTGGSRLCLLLPSGPNAANLLWNLSCLLSSLLQRLLCILCNQSWQVSLLSQPQLSLLLMLVALSSMLSHLHFELLWSEHRIFHLVLFFVLFFTLCIGPTTMQKCLLNGQKVGCNGKCLSRACGHLFVSYS